MPWPYKVVTVVGVFFFIYAIAHFPLAMMRATSIASTHTAEAIYVNGAEKAPLSIIDGSIAADVKADRLWLAYTSDDKDPVAKTQPHDLSVRLAWSHSGECSSWFGNAAGKFETKSDMLTTADGRTAFRAGVWRVETPSLVYDPQDKGREWKLFAFKYFWDREEKYQLGMAQRYSMIVYKTSNDPTKGWSEEKWLFSAAPDYPPPPYQELILLHLDKLSPSLQDIFSYARPSVVLKDGVLFMTLSAFDKDMKLDRIVMISSSDHGNSWAYAGAPLQKADLAALGSGYMGISGASLFLKGGQLYLAAAFAGDKTASRASFIFAFDDPAQGALKRDPQTGAALVVNRVMPPALDFPLYSTGPVIYNEACKDGAMMPVQLGKPGQYGIYSLRQDPLSKKSNE